MLGKLRIVFFILVPLVIQAQANQGAPLGQVVELSVICRLKKEVRTLRVEKAEAGKCNAVYTKGGKDQSIGSASSETSCAEIVQNVRKNLEAAAWKCREIKESRVSNLIEM